MAPTCGTIGVVKGTDSDGDFQVVRVLGKTLINLFCVTFTHRLRATTPNVRPLHTELLRG